MEDIRVLEELADQAWEAADDGNYDLAVKIVRRAVDLDPGNPIFWNDQGMLLKQLGSQSKAAESFLAAISIVPDFAKAYAHLADIRIRQGLVREAVALQQAAVRHAPESTRYAEALDAYRAMTGKVDRDGRSADESHPPTSASGLCPIEQSLRCSYPELASAVDTLDWDLLEASLTAKGYVLIRELLGADICRSLREMFHEDDLYAKTVVMNKGRFGRGCYRYFAAPIPEVVDAIRRIVYTLVAQIANTWQQILDDDERFPVVWEGFRIRCAEADQTTPTPLLLRYEAGGFNDLHRDIRGEIFFPIQMAIVLSPRGNSPTEEADRFHGGDFLFCDDPVRKKSDQHTRTEKILSRTITAWRMAVYDMTGIRFSTDPGP